MNVKTVKRTEDRFDVPVISNLGIQAWGHNNLYPQELLRIVAASESASVCMDRYISFIQGNGFKNINFSAAVLNMLGDTADDILQQLSFDIANFRGMAIQVNYNVFGEIVEANYVPFENCRLADTDDTGYVSKIAVHPDWTGRTKRNGKIIRVNLENIDFIDVFNPRKEVVLAQIQSSGGIEGYKGQILWVSQAGKQTYPKPVHDSVASQMSTEEGLGNIAYRNARCNFMPSAALVFKRGQDVASKENDKADSSQDDDNSISKALSGLQGDINTGTVAVFTVNYDEEIPKKIDLQGQNYDKEYSVTTDTAMRKIYSSFNQEVWYKIVSSSFGFSQQIMSDAYEYYSTVTGGERRMIERAFDKIFKHWNGEPNPTFDFTIQHLIYVTAPDVAQ